MVVRVFDNRFQRISKEMSVSKVFCLNSFFKANAGIKLEVYSSKKLYCFSSNLKNLSGGNNIRPSTSTSRATATEFNFSNNVMKYETNTWLPLSDFRKFSKILSRTSNLSIKDKCALYSLQEKIEDNGKWKCLKQFSILPTGTSVSLTLPRLRSLDPRIHSTRGLKWLTWPTDKLPVSWTRPEKKPHIFNSGDLEQNLGSVDYKQLRPGFEISEELKTASEDVRKLFTLEFAPKKEVTLFKKQEMIRRVQRHPFDKSSPEVQIAEKTYKVRSLQEHVRANHKDKTAKVSLLHAVHRRNKMLKELRKMDYLRFSWLLHELQIVYKPSPLNYVPPKVTRKGELRRLITEYCENMKQEKLKNYREELEKQQELFIKEKQEALSWFEKEKKACKLSTDENAKT
ncbi:28S ribosomal protein S15, mitochondrial-like [Limulus polyphemus]|uniref:Small ribosomal subunit protein uS15m n=1 Tax=Limulus polyphemus TaxID=6850 RepID=A0ABM1BC40_LIMPO|nr:28S ribosomal protein S15, mitochondrial-like [Limulus polyphemus]